MPAADTTAADSEMRDDTHYIDSAEALARFCTSTRDQNWLALDTEFVRERTYFPRLCLIQVGLPGQVACIDVLSVTDLTPLLELMYRPQVTVVLHGGSQDLEIFTGLRGTPPPRVFDTQIAAAMLGQGEQVGYANLVNEMLGVQLDKSQTRTDWCKRPLQPRQLSYAADDVRYLCDIYTRQIERLQQLNRLDWLSADMAALSDPQRYRVDPDNLWLKVKGGQNLRGVQTAILKQLAAWREHEAMARDLPRRWVVADEVLVDLARQQPSELRNVEAMRGLRDGQSRRYAARLLELVTEARQLPHSQWPTQSPRTRLNSGEDALADVLMAIVRLSGNEHGINPGMLCSRRDVEQLATGNRDIALLTGWRAHVAGDRVLSFLEGAEVVRVQDGELVIGARV